MRADRPNEMMKLGAFFHPTGNHVAAWLQAQPGVSSIIIGARRLAQLEDNLQAIDVRLTAGELERLNVLTKPTFGFPQSMQPMFSAIHQGGTTVNGLYAPASGFGIEKGDQPY